MKILVTGNLGFIGSNFVNYWLKNNSNDTIIGLDFYTYAANPEYFSKINKKPINQFIADIADFETISKIIQIEEPDHIIHFAAESHVCRSIETPLKFIYSNINGTANLLQAFYELWKDEQGHRFHHVSTDEVYGELELNEKELFHEDRKYAPRSPYAASKASSDFLVQAYYHTYKLDCVITNCSNNFGPGQHEEKLIPKTIISLLNGNPVTMYGSGEQRRDWLWVYDHCKAIELVFKNAQAGETYCIGGENEMSNIEIIHTIKDILDKLGILKDEFKIIRTNDRKTDDLRYAIDITKIKKLGFKPNKELFKKNLLKTINWYINEYI